MAPPAAMWLNYHYKFNETSLTFFPPKDKDVQPPTIDNTSAALCPLMRTLFRARPRSRRR